MESKTRIGGSGFTTMTFRGTRLAYLQTLQDTPPQPVAGAQVVQSIDDETPSEIVTAMAVGAGTLRLTFYELWNEPVWSRLPGLEGTNNLLEVLKRQVALGEVTCRKLIKSPSGITRARVYHGCVLTDIDEGEQINIGTMTLPKTITMQYVKTTTV
ncbi:hypothetical protein SEA_TYKE_128 [Mycobacterium phage Tyke]|uniref:Tail tube protein n=23 Tax=Bixzunavirus TaxID=680114 RepID=R4TCV8_9CAUD|nr:virion structural protein [Mycobacterium phage ScottMcG]YP_002224376.1 virion structural protein [Mycobacterium phage Spud]YP_003347795.1 virion structural protein [Mycobacterium phage ET08]YP_008061616.1 virion structural protein [Mycobacterium phage Astraea]YP_009014715.1 virion structural protein [Mycobacterium phage LinStu]YP_009204681.1 virion structural protein [Mycobacterium phage HyRo]YP_009216381.1 virion structural protein [Mycobacterium phage Alice]YP_009608808.1 virion structu